MTALTPAEKRRLIDITTNVFTKHKSSTLLDYWGLPQDFVGRLSSDGSARDKATELVRIIEGNTSLFVIYLEGLAEEIAGQKDDVTFILAIKDKVSNRNNTITTTLFTPQIPSPENDAELQEKAEVWATVILILVIMIFIGAGIGIVILFPASITSAVGTAILGILAIGIPLVLALTHDPVRKVLQKRIYKNLKTSQKVVQPSISVEPSVKQITAGVSNQEIPNAVLIDYFNAMRGKWRDISAGYITLTGEETNVGYFDESMFPSAYKIEPHAHYRRNDDHESESIENVADKLLTIERGVLLGDPGSGKTWTLYRTALTLAEHWQQETLKTTTQSSRIPIIVPLKEFNGATEDNKAQTLEEFIQIRCLGALAAYWNYLFSNHRILLLCDALNEMPGTSPADGRDLIKTEIIPFLQKYKEDVPFVVSCRVAEYENEITSLRPLEQITLQDLTLPQIHQLFVVKLGDVGNMLWRKIGGSDNLLDFWEMLNRKNLSHLFWQHRIDFDQEIWEHRGYRNWQSLYDDRSPSRLMLLSRNPFLADKLCQVYGPTQQLPQNRVKLFSQFIDSLLQREQLVENSRPAFEETMVKIAEAMQEAQRTVLLIEQVRDVVGNDKAELIEVGIAANLLNKEGTTISFSHQLFQEYYAVHVLFTALEKRQSAKRFFKPYWWNPGVWRETFVLLGESLGGMIGATRVAKWVAPVSPEFAIEIIKKNEGGHLFSAVEPALYPDLIKSAHAKTCDSNPIGRASAYRVLGLLSADNRKGIGVVNKFPDITWCYVPNEGKVTLDKDPIAYQSTDTWNGEIAEYWISKYPITYQQFETFVAAPDGSRDERWWQGFRGSHWWNRFRRPNLGLSEQAFKYINHPRERISWYDAMAFCRWLGIKMQGDENAIRLPTEKEWEKAARWNPRTKTTQIFPWSGEYVSGYANIDERINMIGNYYLGMTGAVGMYPQNESPYGVMDMVGNVWEWTITDYVSGSNHIKSSSSARVLKGGSWESSLGFARVAARTGLRSRPDYQSDYIGFRVVSLLNPTLLPKHFTL